jgi:hypothetical protein
MSITLSTAPVRQRLLLECAAGVVACRLTSPTFPAGPRSGWTAPRLVRQAARGIDPANGWSAALVSMFVAALPTALLPLSVVVRVQPPIPVQ